MASSAPQRAEGVPLLELTPAQLAAFTGADGVSPIYICLSGVIYDVSAGRDFYGPGGNYHVFAGRDASQPLATMDIKSVSTDVSNLTDEQKETLQEWIVKYNTKYTVVGRLIAPAAL